MTTCLPIATWPELDYYELGKYPQVGIPVLYRLVFDPYHPDELKQILKRVMPENTALRIANLTMRDKAIIFGLGHKEQRTPSSIVVLEGTLTTGAPGTPTGDWYAEKFYSQLSWYLGGGDVDAEDERGSLERERRRLIWLLCDLLEFRPPDFSEQVDRELMIPAELRPAGDYDRVLASAAYRHLRNLQQQIKKEHDLLELCQEGVQSDESEGWQSEASKEYERRTGQRPYQAQIYVHINRLHEARVMAMQITARICDIHFGSKVKKEDLRTIASPYMNLTAGLYRDWLIIVQPREGEMVWSLFSADRVKTPVAASSRGPMELLRQAGLVVYSEEEWDQWVDDNMLPGDLSYDDEAYLLLREQPLLWGNDEFFDWASELEEG